eukprot:3516291-Rhodomonas_salina.2
MSAVPATKHGDDHARDDACMPGLTCEGAVSDSLLSLARSSPAVAASRRTRGGRGLQQSPTSPLRTPAVRTLCRTGGQGRWTRTPMLLDRPRTRIPGGSLLRTSPRFESPQEQAPAGPRLDFIPPDTSFGTASDAARCGFPMKKSKSDPRRRLSPIASFRAQHLRLLRTLLVHRHRAFGIALRL